MNDHKNVRSKMKKNRALLEHPIVSQHVPETLWYNETNLMSMLSRHGSVYLKPSTGKQGSKIYRVKKVDESSCELSDNQFSKIIKIADASTELGYLMAKRPYIIQQRIDLATHRGCPFDIRMVMQKPYSTWELTLTAAKVALKEDAVVTNVSKGAKDYPLNEILLAYDQKLDPISTLKELVDLAHQISSFLGEKFPFRIIGLDMAIDKAGKIWFIEANTRPQCLRCKRVNDECANQKYENAKKIIKGERQKS